MTDMQITAPKKNLIDALNKVVRALNKRQNDPERNYAVKVSTHYKDGVEFYASTTSLDVRVTAAVTDIQTEGTVTVDGKALISILRNMPAKYDVELTAEGGMLNIKPETLDTRATQLPQLNFVNPLRFDSLLKHTGTVNAADFSHALDRVNIAAAPPKQFPKLSCVHVSVTGEVLELAATDRYRLARRRLAWEPAGGELDIAIAADSAKKLVKVLGKTPKGGVDVYARPGSKVVMFEVEGMRVLCDLNSLEEYPHLSGLMEPVQRLLKVQVSTLADSVKRFKKIEGTRATMQMDFTADGLRMTATHVDRPEGLTEVIPCDMGGDVAQFTMGVDPKFLSDALKNIDGEYVSFGVNEPYHPVFMFDGASALPEGENGPVITSELDSVYLQMPVRL